MDRLRSGGGSEPPAPIRPEYRGPSVENTLAYLNHQLYISQDYWDSKCRDRIQVSLSDDQTEILVKYVLIDRGGRIKANMAPKYVYHVPIAAIRSVYTYGSWTTKDRVVARTRGRAVTKYGPVWDCGHNRLNDRPKESFLDSVDLKGQDTDEGHLNDIAKAINRLVERLKAKLDAKPASQKKETHDSDKIDSFPDHP
jgi:hypothetical protein